MPSRLRRSLLADAVGERAGTCGVDEGEDDDGRVVVEVRHCWWWVDRVVE